MWNSVSLGVSVYMGFVQNSEHYWQLHTACQSKFYIILLNVLRILLPKELFSRTKDGQPCSQQNQLHYVVATQKNKFCHSELNNLVGVLMTYLHSLHFSSKRVFENFFFFFSVSMLTKYSIVMLFRDHHPRNNTQFFLTCASYNF